MQIEERSQNGKLEDLDLIDVARDFDVSSEALTWRLVSLRFLTEDQARIRLAESEFRRRDRMSVVGLWTEPPKGLPEWYRRLVRMAYDKGVLSRVRAAEYLGQSPADLWELDWGDVAGEATASAPEARTIIRPGRVHD